MEWFATFGAVFGNVNPGDAVVISAKSSGNRVEFCSFKNGTRESIGSVNRHNKLVRMLASVFGRMIEVDLGDGTKVKLNKRSYVKIVNNHVPKGHCKATSKNIGMYKNVYNVFVKKDQFLKAFDP